MTLWMRQATTLDTASATAKHVEKANDIAKDSPAKETRIWSMMLNGRNG